jgi:hypothetical protein
MIGQQIQMKSGGLVLEGAVYIHSPKVFLTESCSLQHDASSPCPRCGILFATTGASMGKEAPICTFPVSSWRINGYRNPGSSRHQMMRIDSFSKLR